MMRPAQEVDDKEDAEHGVDNRGGDLQGEMARRNSRLVKIRRAKQDLEQHAREQAASKAGTTAAKSGHSGDVAEEAARRASETATPKPKAQRNFTDSDSRIMKTADGSFHYCYNAQAVVDEANQVICPPTSPPPAPTIPPSPTCSPRRTPTPRSRRLRRWPMPDISAKPTSTLRSRWVLMRSSRPGAWRTGTRCRCAHCGTVPSDCGARYPVRRVGRVSGGTGSPSAPTRPASGTRRSSATPFRCALPSKVHTALPVNAGPTLTPYCPVMPGPVETDTATKQHRIILPERDPNRPTATRRNRRSPKNTSLLGSRHVGTGSRADRRLRGSAAPTRTPPPRSPRSGRSRTPTPT